MIEALQYHWVGQDVRPRLRLTAQSRIMRAAPKIRGRMREEKPTPVDMNRWHEIEKYPELFKGEERVRVDHVSGELYISSYRNKKKVWSHYKDIDSAIRATSHILGKYDKKTGMAILSTKKIIKIIQEHIPDLKDGRINKDEMDRMCLNIEKTLTESGFIRSPLPNKKEIVKQLRRSARPDTKGRFNPLVSRSRMASSWLKLIKELLVADKVRGKYNHILGLLLTEKEIEHAKIYEAYTLMSDIISYSLEDANDLKLRIAFLKKVRWENLNSGIRTAPYRKGALLSAAILFGYESEHHRELIKKIAGEDTKLYEAISKIIPLDKFYDEYGVMSPEYVMDDLRRRVDECLILLSQSANP